MSDTVDTVVARGIAALDADRLDWPERVDPDRLDLHDEYACVLGQAYGAYWHGLTVLFGADNPDLDTDAVDIAAAAHGFVIYDPDDDLADDAIEYDYPALTAAWRAAIRARREED